MTSVAELIRGVRIALGLAMVSECPSFDTDADGQVTVAELIQAVTAALTGCPASTSLRSVVMQLRPSGTDDVVNYEVFNAYSAERPAADGSAAVRIAQDTPTTTLAVSTSGPGLFAAMTFPGDEPSTIDAQSTAEALLLINPVLVPRTPAEHLRIVAAVRGSSTVQALGHHIDSIYARGGDALADEQVQQEAAAALAEVLDLVAEQSAQAAVGVSTQSEDLCTTNDDLRICAYDLAALTLEGSGAQRLVVAPREYGAFHLQINVDWAVRIVELDRDLIPPIYTQGNQFVFSPDLIDAWIKVGGVDRQIIVNGAVFGGWYGTLTDPIGTLLEQVGESVARDGVAISGNGIFAVVAISGGTNNDASEYAAVQASAWQRALFARAFTTNVFAVAYDTVGTLLDVLGPGALGSELEARRFTAALTTVTEALQSNPDHVGINLLSDLANAIIGEVIDVRVAQISQKTAMLRLVGSVFGVVPRFFGVVTGSLGATTRIGDLIRNVTPRESAYAALLPTGSLIGEWTGDVMQLTPPVGSYPVVMTITDSTSGQPGGSVEYPSLHCGGTLTVIASEAGGASFRERIRETNRCVDGGMIAVQLETDEHLGWQWFYPTGRLAATATLKRADAAGQMRIVSAGGSASR